MGMNFLMILIMKWTRRIKRKIRKPGLRVTVRAKRMIMRILTKTLFGKRNLKYL